MPVVTGIAQWASLAKPNDLSEKYQIDVCHLSEADVKQLEKQGVTNVHEETSRADDKEPRGYYITMRSNAISKAGKVLAPPDVVDAKKKPLPRGVWVGNGSKVNVVYDTFDWTYKKKAGISAGLRIVQVIELVEYVAPDDSSGLDDLEEEEGFTAPDDGSDELDDKSQDDQEEGDGENPDDEIPF